MPTSSQALILKNTDGIIPREFSKVNFTETRPCQVSKISLQSIIPYVSTDSFITYNRSSQDIDLRLGRDKNKINSHIGREKFPTATAKGYRSVYAFDPISRSFSWQLLSVDSFNRLPSPIKQKFSTRFYKNRSRITPSPECATTTKETEDMPLGRIPDPDTFESNIKRLMDLGFRTDSKSSPNVESNKQVAARSNKQESTSSGSLDTSNKYKTPHTKKKIVGSPLLPSKIQSTSGVSDLADKSIPRQPPSRMDRFVLNYKSISTPMVTKTEEKASSSAEDVTKKKKKMYIPTIRMRRELPPMNPSMLCFTLYDGDLSHKDVKNMIETQCDSRIIELKFDPVYIHLGDASSQYKCMWVFSITDQTARSILLANGLRYNGERIRVRLYDDVMREEHNAYKFFKEVQKEQIDKKVFSSDSKWPGNTLGYDSPKLSTNIKLTVKKVPTNTKASRTRRRHVGKISS